MLHHVHISPTLPPNGRPAIVRTKNVWSKPWWLMNQRVRNSPMTTLMNAIASSKQGQSSTGSGCRCTQRRQMGMTVAGTVCIPPNNRGMMRDETSEKDLTNGDEEKGGNHAPIQPLYLTQLSKASP